MVRLSKLLIRSKNYSLPSQQKSNLNYLLSPSPLLIPKFSARKILPGCKCINLGAEHFGGHWYQLEGK